MALVAALAGLASAVADLRQAQQRLLQAAAARHAAAGLAAAAATGPAPAGPPLAAADSAAPPVRPGRPRPGRAGPPGGAGGRAGPVGRPGPAGHRDTARRPGYVPHKRPKGSLWTQGAPARRPATRKGTAVEPNETHPDPLAQGMSAAGQKVAEAAAILALVMQVLIG